jgi:hypothetical protein
MSDVGRLLLLFPELFCFAKGRQTVWKVWSRLRVWRSAAGGRQICAV